jgi:hypothetical protein
MIAATALAVFFIPVFFVVMQRLSELRPWVGTSHAHSIALSEEPAEILTP